MPAWAIASTATEEPVFDGDRLSDELPRDWFERCEAAEINWDELLSAAVCPWFAECWQAIGGPALFSPAFLFLHSYHDRQYHVIWQQRRRVGVEGIAHGQIDSLAASSKASQGLAHPPAIGLLSCRHGPKPRRAAVVTKA